MGSSNPLLDVSLQVDFANRPMALRSVCFKMQPGEILGLVGESAAGKSTIALAVLGLLRWKGGRACGRILLHGRDLLAYSEPELEKIRGRDVSLILQSPLASLNPVLRIGTQLEEAWQVHERGNRNDRKDAVGRALTRVGLPADDEFRRRYPSQISVGQAQRVLIAMAVMHSPALLVADEPTSALDAITQKEILEMLASLNREMGTAILYISHDLLSVAAVCHRIAILHDGEIVECGTVEQVLSQPQHPFTRRLLECVPWLPGQVHHPGNLQQWDARRLPEEDPPEPFSLPTLPHKQGLKSMPERPM